MALLKLTSPVHCPTKSIVQETGSQLPVLSFWFSADLELDNAPLGQNVLNPSETKWEYWGQWKCHLQHIQ